ncbi:hypothetical protein BNJ_00171 [Kaumoebavirus]|uniref:hypothetical protein n=1 Tax=Kaumoebavirus TaxID=1859492 RepID=UPI0009C2A93A|nr:hypothetical protein BNJ_00171 [Kaumoebavirus]ARA72003.1 hypothetical protein BNJ_00171 [Kaumoebavirus]
MFPDKNRESGGIFEDDRQLEFHGYSTLRDFSPDRPTLESDMPRNNRVNSGRMINFHTYGVAGSTADPYNDNINTQFTDWDPRGTNVDPDFNKFKNAAWSRADDWEHKFTSDADDKVTEGIKNPYDVQEDIKNAFYQTKSRLKIFEESQGNYAPGFRPTSENNSLLTRTTAEGANMYGDLPFGQQDYMSRRNPVDLLSNMSPRLAREATDHEFKVSSYGKLYSAKVADLEGSKIDKVEVDQLAPILDSSKSTLANKSKLAIAILTSAKKKVSVDQKIALSRELAQVGKSKAKRAAESQASLIILDQVSPEVRGLIRRNINRAAPKFVGDADSNLTKVDGEVKIAAIHSKEGKHRGKQMSMSEFDPLGNKREAVVYVKHRGDMKVVSYSTKLPEIPTQYGAVTDADMAMSMNSMERGVGVYMYTPAHVNSAENEVVFGENKWLDRHLAPVGSKYIGKHQEETDMRDETALGEITHDKKGKRATLSVKKAGKHVSERSSASGSSIETR